MSDSKHPGLAAVVGLLLVLVPLAALLLTLNGPGGTFDFYCDGFSDGVELARTRGNVVATECVVVEVNEPDNKRLFCLGVAAGYERTLEPVAGPAPDGWAEAFTKSCLDAGRPEAFYAPS